MSFVRKIPKDFIRSADMLKNAQKAIESAKSMTLNEVTSNSVLRELYEGFRQYCEAIGYSLGYKFMSHEAIVSFLSDILKETSISLKFDRYRKLRNRINYYGSQISLDGAKEALIEIPSLIKLVSKHLEIK